MISTAAVTKLQFVMIAGTRPLRSRRWNRMHSRPSERRRLPG